MAQAHDAASTIVRQLSQWRPPLRSADADTLGDIDGAKARSRDLIRNNPFAKNALRILRDSVIGPGLRLSLKPDHVSLGIPAETARSWAKKAERRWELYANSPGKYADARRMQTFNQICQTIVNSLFMNGEALLVVAHRPNETGIGTCFQLVEPDRLSNPDGKRDGALIRKGVEFDHFGGPVAYWIREAHASDRVFGDSRAKKWKRIARMTRYGRPNVIHLFDHERVEMTRGITDFASAIKPMRMLSHYQDVELESAIVQAVFAASIETELDYEKSMALIGADKIKASGLNPATAMAVDHMSQVADYHKQAGFSWGGARAIHLLPNEKLHLYRSSHPSSGFADFEQAVLRQVAAGTGAPIAALSQNYKDINYSAARAALQDVWRHYMSTRELIVQGFAWPAFAAWLEETVATGQLELPEGVENFHSGRDALCRGKFFSWGKPMLDPVKERRAQQMGLSMGVETLESICATAGLDWEEVLEQRAREVETMAELGLEPWEVDPALLYSVDPDSANKGGTTEGNGAKE